MLLHEILSWLDDFERKNRIIRTYRVEFIEVAFCSTGEVRLIANLSPPFKKGNPEDKLLRQLESDLSLFAYCYFESMEELVPYLKQGEAKNFIFPDE